MRNSSLTIVVLVMLNLWNQQGMTQDLSVHIPARSKEFHDDTTLPAAFGLDRTATFTRPSNLRLFAKNISLYTSNITENTHVPFAGYFYQVKSLGNREIVITVVPEKSIPEERRVPAGRLVVPERSNCHTGVEFSVLNIVNEKNELRCEIYDSKAAQQLPKTYGVGDSFELKNRSFLIKRILPAEKNFPAWVEFEHSEIKSTEK